MTDLSGQIARYWDETGQRSHFVYPFREQEAECIGHYRTLAESHHIKLFDIHVFLVDPPLNAGNQLRTEGLIGVFQVGPL